MAVVVRDKVATRARRCVRMSSNKVMKALLANAVPMRRKRAGRGVSLWKPFPVGAYVPQ